MEQNSYVYTLELTEQQARKLSYTNKLRKIARRYIQYD